MQTQAKTDTLISVIIPAYNAEAFIKKALDSVLQQSYPHFEALIINDGSTDRTVAIIDEYQDPRIKLITQVNGGLSNARNTGIQTAQGDYLAFLDADDYWEVEKLEKQIALLKQNPDIGFCSSQSRIETPEGVFLNHWHCPEISVSTLHSIFIHNAAITGSGSGVMVTKELQKQAGFFDESLESLEDIDMWMRYAAFSEYCCLPETLTIITKRPDSMSRNLVTMRKSAIQVLKKNRALLDKSSQKGFWHACYASMLCDYAKWEARNGLKMTAISHLILALVHAPRSRGRLCLSLLFAITFNKPLD
ncbi:MAG: glycosyltransferase [Methyloprofundus sp.]|nr:glycosyltransferase [Methyloprofundus sp.]